LEYYFNSIVERNGTNLFLPLTTFKNFKKTNLIT
jgi:hypothetical protein